MITFYFMVSTVAVFGGLGLIAVAIRAGFSELAKAITDKEES